MGPKREPTLVGSPPGVQRKPALQRSIKCRIVVELLIGPSRGHLPLQYEHL